MKTQFSSILVAMGLLLVTISCNNESAPEMSVDNSLSKEASIEKLPSDIEDLSLSDAETVANLFNNKSTTRSQQEKTIKNVIAINGKDGNPAIYAVNFNEDGYILVSATTKYYPILATVDHGEYSDDMPDTGQQIVIAGMLDNIELIKSGKTDFDCRPLWNKYINGNKPAIDTRASDDYQQAFNEWYNSQAYGDYRIMKLTRCGGILPSNVYSQFVSAAQSEDLWEGTEYSWNNTAYVVERTTETSNTYGPFLNTTWGQNSQYNTSGHAKLGCVTVAVGQLMKFFKRPTSISWDYMPNKLEQYETSPVLTDFLAKLRGELGVSEAGGATIGDAKRVLTSYGYNVTQNDHMESKVFSYISTKRRPLYARGQNDNGDGHAWVIAGAYQHTTNISYTLYRLTDTKYPQFQYDKAEAADPYNNYSHVYSYYMNWGWNGTGNGWYSDYYIVPSGVSGDCNFKNHRKELYINNF